MKNNILFATVRVKCSFVISKYGGVVMLEECLGGSKGVCPFGGGYNGKKRIDRLYEFCSYATPSSQSVVTRWRLTPLEKGIFLISVAKNKLSIKKFP